METIFRYCFLDVVPSSCCSPRREGVDRPEQSSLNAIGCLLLEVVTKQFLLGNASHSMNASERRILVFEKRQNDLRAFCVRSIS